MTSVSCAGVECVDVAGSGFAGGGVDFTGCTSILASCIYLEQAACPFDARCGIRPQHFGTNFAARVRLMRYDFLLLGIVLLAQTPQGLDTGVQRGRKTIKHPVPGNRPAEVCIEPRHIPGVAYRTHHGDDEKTEDRLCSYDFYQPGPTSKDGGVATCPHATSTAGSIEFQEIEKGFNREQLQTSKNCGRERPTPKLTRFKTTDTVATNTYAPGAMLAYHVSRVLGDILFVPASVLRTVDTAIMRDVATRAPAVVTNDLLRTSFATYLVALKDPAHWTKTDIFTKDHQQLWGFLRAKVSDDTTYPGWIFEITPEKFESEHGVQDAFSSTPAKSLFGSTMTQESLQRLMLARDFADLIVFDEIMSQGDRLTGLNLSSVWYYYYPSHDGLESVARGRVDEGKAQIPHGAMLVRRLVASDNDCVIICANQNAIHGYTARLQHLHPRTYEGVMRLNDIWTHDTSIKQQLALDLAIPPAAMTSFGTSLQAVANTLQQNCVSGKLKLDLDPDVVFGNKSAPSCSSAR